MIAAIDLGIDTSIGRNLNDLAVFHAQDPKIHKTVEAIKQRPTLSDERYLLRRDILYSKDSKSYPNWRPVLPSELEKQVTDYVHTSLQHLGTEKCMAQIANTFHVKGLGRKVRKMISFCDICQRVKHPNRSYAAGYRSHLPTSPGELCACDLFGHLSVSLGGVRYIFVILDVFSKFVKLYALRAATTRTSLNKILGDYVTHLTQPKCMSDNGSQFSSPLWRKKLTELNIDVKFSPVRHPQANPSERFMNEKGKFCRIYCDQNHKKWPDLLDKIEKWLNETISDSTGYSAVELMYNKPWPDLFSKFLNKEKDQQPPCETLQEKAFKAYLSMKEKAARRTKKHKLAKTKLLH